MAPPSSTNPSTGSHHRPCLPSLPGCLGSRWTTIASAPNNFRTWLASRLEHIDDVVDHHRRSRHSFQTLLVGTSIGQVGFALTISCSLVLSLTRVWHLLPACDSCDYDNTLEASAWLAWGVFFDPGTQTNLLPDDSSVWHKAAAAVFSSPATQRDRRVDPRVGRSIQEAPQHHHRQRPRGRARLDRQDALPARGTRADAP